MSILNTENLFYKTVEYIPGIGTLYSLPRSLVYAAHGDAKEAVTSALNLFQGVVRDTVILMNAEVATQVTVVHAVLENVSDEFVSQILTPQNKEKLHQGITRSKEKQKNGGRAPEEKHHFLLVPPKRDDNGTYIEHEFNEKIQGNAKTITKLIQLHGAIYRGKLNYKENADNEIMVLVAPKGFTFQAKIYTYWQWSINYQGNSKVSVSYEGEIDEQTLRDPNKLKFAFYKADPDIYYWFEATIDLKGKSNELSLTMNSRNPSKTPENITLYLDRYIKITD